MTEKPTEKLNAPRDYDELMRVIHSRYDSMSKSYQTISVYLTQNPNEIAVNPVNAIAERCGVHASSFVRYAQSLGYTGFKDLQSLFQKRLEMATPGSQSSGATLANDFDSNGPSDSGFLRDLVVKDIAVMQEMAHNIPAEDLGLAADLLYHADSIYLLGQLRSQPVVEYMRYLLTMIGKRCLLLDTSGGLATHITHTMTESDVLLAVSFRYYANEVVSIVENAGKNNRDIVAISDSTLSPLAKYANVLFPVPEHRHKFPRSLAAPMCIAQALVISTAARGQGFEENPKIPGVTETRERDARDTLD